ncbi:glycosyltransferase family 39 protein [Sphingomonas sp. NFR15]|uniref:glycosyltransferase family 39 protein n=1 Tax=Sphingomonas sp. NFR15 TaxID=1566282 RepID=UPI0008854BF8|nr:glycosyltransferase family 39 protein [Sphingomonas sp. NFR15]SDA29099.1 Dolichyl-phosphate-mannose-protein mannosyltransferase [Sphingomonas sp. NFR15]
MTERRITGLLCGIMLLGLGLRVASARGGLWLDEAWSAELAREVGTPLGVFLSINHDNNHHVNSLWMQFVGFGAPPMLQRALSIAAGTIAIAVAAMILRPRGTTTALIAASLFAVSPMMVTMGSEARGYAPMSLAFLSAILLVARWLPEQRGERVRLRLALCFALGTLSQMTMVFGCVALIGWVFFALAKRMAPLAAAGRTLRLFTPALLSLAAVLGLIFGAAHASATGFQFGAYEPFDIMLFLHAVIEMLGYTIGWPVVSLWLIPAVLTLVLLAQGGGATHRAFYRLAIVAFPVTLAVLHAGNPGHPRYYLVAAIGLLLLLAELIGSAIGRAGWRRAFAVAALAAILTGGAWRDADLIRNQRGDPDPAIAAMRARAPGGSAVLLDRSTGFAMLAAAAAHARYPLTIVRAGCAPARFLFLDRFKGEDFPRTPVRCGADWRPIAGAHAHGLSGTHWTLYVRRR